MRIAERIPNTVRPTSCTRKTVFPRETIGMTRALTTLCNTNDFDVYLAPRQNDSQIYFFSTLPAEYARFPLFAATVTRVQLGRRRCQFCHYNPSRTPHTVANSEERRHFHPATFTGRARARTRRHIFNVTDRIFLSLPLKNLTVLFVHNSVSIVRPVQRSEKMRKN